MKEDLEHVDVEWLATEYERYKSDSERLRAALAGLYIPDHHSDEFPCPSENGVCWCGADEQNAQIDHALDPSKSLDQYRRERSRNTGRQRLAEIREYMAYPGYEAVDREYIQRRGEAELSSLFAAHPWLKEEDNEHHRSGPATLPDGARQDQG